VYSLGGITFEAASTETSIYAIFPAAFAQLIVPGPVKVPKFTTFPVADDFGGMTTTLMPSATG